MKVFLICGCSDGTERTDGLHVMRQLRARGHEVTLFGKETFSCTLLRNYFTTKRTLIVHSTGSVSLRFALVPFSVILIRRMQTVR